MPDPTPERIAAALALAEAYNDWHMGKDRTSDRLVLAWKAYRATAPKPLRTRAEVDAEIVGAVRHHAELWPPEGPIDPYAAGERWRRIKALCAEPTADPQPHGSSSDRVGSPPRVDAAAGAAYSGPRPTPATKESSDTAGVEAGAANRITDHDADQREEGHPDDRPCGCEDSDELRDAVNEAAKLLNAIHEMAKSIVDLSRRVP